jgi:hypothetical protein
MPLRLQIFATGCSYSAYLMKIWFATDGFTT